MWIRFFGAVLHALLAGHRLTQPEPAHPSDPAERGGASDGDEPRGESSKAERVALLVVHGVADQKPGATPASVVDLLVSRAPQGVRYAAVSSDQLTIAVAPLEPRIEPPAKSDGKTESRLAGVLPKGLVQSVRSDFQRPEWKVQSRGPTGADDVGDTDDSGGAPSWAEKARPMPGDGAAAKPVAEAISEPRTANGDEAGIDQGLKFSNFLLNKHIRNGARRESWRSTRIGLERIEGDTATRIDVYEMYWADLSRLAGAIPRIVTELFTLVFRLSNLGRETVDLARVWFQTGKDGQPCAARAWSLVATLQIAIDWGFVNVLALVFLQLALLGLALIALGLASAMQPGFPKLHHWIAGATLGAGVLWGIYCFLDGRRWASFAFFGALALVVAGLSAIFLEAFRPILLPVLLLCGIWLVNELLLRPANDRFPFVLAIGRLLAGAVLLVLIASAAFEAASFGAFSRAAIPISIHAALFAVEATLWVIKWWWILMGPVILLWFCAGIWVGWGKEARFAARASIATGRLGLAASLCTFLMLTMTVWAMLSAVLEDAVEGVAYAPCIFTVDARTVEGPPPGPPPEANNRCLRSSAAVQPLAGGMPLRAVHGKDFLADRYRMSTATFSAIAVVLGMLLVWIIGMLVPSVLAETRLLAARSRRPPVAGPGDGPDGAAAANLWDAVRTRRLGRWLRRGFFWLDAAVFGVVGAAVALALVVALLFAAPSLPWVQRIVSIFENDTTSASELWLHVFVFSATSVLAGLTLLGGLLSRYAPWLRGPLDVGLDVDNHFREFPRKAIPRARIFSRYAALLAHVHARRYDRIVIVAHSQGTVISAELLRFLASKGNRPPGAGDVPRIDADPTPLAPIRLLTLGCPLRQLYAARFPILYRWVLHVDDGVCGPRASDIGVARWVNAYCSGDYVGRWLWSNADADPDRTHPMTDGIDRIASIKYAALGRLDAYRGFQPMPPDWASLAGAREFELCLGHGAHTHYFDSGQRGVASLIDHLIGAKEPRANQPP
ncbi:MAG: hypothetical protein ABI589_04400 [Burkholderiales bacterium]